MAFKSEVTGVRSLINRLTKFGRVKQTQTIRALNASVLLVQNTARKSVQKGPKTGRIYKRGKITHQTSAPGEPPATDTGFLVSRILGDVDEQRFKGFVTAGTKYARPLELGSKRLKPRPFMRPAIRSNIDKIRRIFIQELSKDT